MQNLSAYGDALVELPRKKLDPSASLNIFVGKASRFNQQAIHSSSDKLSMSDQSAIHILTVLNFAEWGLVAHMRVDACRHEGNEAAGSAPCRWCITQACFPLTAVGPCRWRGGVKHRSPSLNAKLPCMRMSVAPGSLSAAEGQARARIANRKSEPWHVALQDECPAGSSCVVQRALNASGPRDEYICI